jgi:hypothetical protein
MLLSKSLGIGWARVKAYKFDNKDFEADLKDGDIIKILDGGTEVINKFNGKPQTAFKIQTRNGVKALSFNGKSKNNLIDVFGGDTENWIGKEVKVWAVKAMVANKMQTVVYLAEPSWTMDEEANFKGEKMESDDDGIDDINFDESQG